MASSHIKKACEDEFYAVAHDCSAFVKAVAKKAFANQPFSGQADDILAFLATSANGWADLGNSIAKAIQKAKAGDLVVAGMTSTQLGGAHGHLAIVLGVDGQDSGSPPVKVPLGYARSLKDKDIDQDKKGPTEVYGERLSGTFPAPDVRAEKVAYYSKKTDTWP